ncbi:MAG: S41 family peptidase [Candidatus Yonathbacteria bacterium]|nr:S41 family peptidase [Candidatus Yonathbacteria bacterium]
MMNNSYRRILLSVGALVLTAGIFVFGVYSGYTNRPEAQKIAHVLGMEPPVGIASDVDFEPFWKVWNLLDEKYHSTKEPANSQQRVWGAIQGLVAATGDPYTVFFPPEESEKFADDISGEFQGVGMEIGIHEGVLTVIAPLKNTPAERAGMRSGDIILKIDETVTTNLSAEDAVKLIRGTQGSTVKLTILHEGSEEPVEISIVRGVISIPTIDTEIRSATTGEIIQKAGAGDVFVIHLYNFSAQSASLFRDALRTFTLSGTHKLILDLRGNPGGYLEAAADMASWFLPAGKPVVRESFGDGIDEQVYRSKGYNIFNDSLRMVILTDQGSASASEILAGALSEHGVATLVGTRTFGKGSVQELIPITDTTSLKVTVARWLTPNGISISEGGLTPAVEIHLTQEDVDAKRDPQMEKAIEVVNK